MENGSIVYEVGFQIYEKYFVSTRENTFYLSVSDNLEIYNRVFHIY